MWNKIKHCIVAPCSACMLFIMPSCKHGTSIDNKTKDIVITADSLNFNCIMEYYTDVEGWGIEISKLLLNDTLSLLRVQDSYYSPYIQVTLTDSVSDYIKSLLHEIYSEHKSVVKDQYINANYYVANVVSKWDITINLNGTKTTETIDVYNYEITFDNPFWPQFEKLLWLIYAITNKMERDIYFYTLRFDYSQSEEWITEMFHGNYYEPYNDINSTKYVIPK